MKSIVGVILWLGVPLALSAGFSYWQEDGYVESPPAGEALTLTGVPGDEINLKLRLPGDSQPNKNEWAASLRDLHSDFTTVLPLKVEQKDEEDDEPAGIYGRFTVPKVPGRSWARLAGILEGTYRIRGGGQERIEIPLKLAIVPREEGGTTSGMLDRSFPEGLLVTGITFLTCAIALSLLAILVLGATYLARLVAGAVRNARRAVRP